MQLTPKLALGFWNAWLLCVPWLLIGGVVAAWRKDVARRMSDMTGYGAVEKLVTVAASLAPYPFIGVAVWTPIASTGALLISGLVMCAMGTVAFLSTLTVFAHALKDQLLQAGLYRVSRNPLYASAACVFLGICLATGSLVLCGIFVVLLVLQHFMILAEERACTRKYGESYMVYARRVPRYLAWI
jgi:protein-S-isoprenylcysteine O-methyltransferase Ste14